MTLQEIEFDTAELLSDKKISEDFYKYAVSEGLVSGECYICNLDGEEFVFPLTSELAVLTRVCQFDYVFACTEARVVVAVGGVVSESCGIVTPRYFFAKLYYNESCILNTIDMNTSELML